MFACTCLCEKLEIARILVFGNVQGVGFRAYIKQIARNMQVNGFARNLDDGSVEIYAQAPKPTISTLIKRITIRGIPSDPLSLHVAKTTIAFGHSRDFKKPGRKLKAFEIDYGKRLKAEAKETIEKAEIATLIMHSLKSETTRNFTRLRSETNENFRKLGSETNENFKKLTSGIDENFTRLGTETNENLRKLGSETNENFTKLDSKYGSISKILSSINNSIKQNNKILSRVAGKFAAV